MLTYFIIYIVFVMRYSPAASSVTNEFFCRRVLPENSRLHYLLPEKVDLGIMN